MKKGPGAADREERIEVKDKEKTCSTSFIQSVQITMRIFAGTSEKIEKSILTLMSSHSIYY